MDEDDRPVSEEARAFVEALSTHPSLTIRMAAAVSEPLGHRCPSPSIGADRAVVNRRIKISLLEVL